MAAGGAVEEERHALLRAGAEKHGLVVQAAGVGALHVLGARQGRVRPYVLQDHRALALAVLDLVPARSARPPEPLRHQVRGAARLCGIAPLCWPGCKPPVYAGCCMPRHLPQAPLALTSPDSRTAAQAPGSRSRPELDQRVCSHTARPAQADSGAFACTACLPCQGCANAGTLVRQGLHRPGAKLAHAAPLLAGCRLSAPNDGRAEHSFARLFASRARTTQLEQAGLTCRHTSWRGRQARCSRSCGTCTPGAGAPCPPVQALAVRARPACAGHIARSAPVGRAGRWTRGRIAAAGPWRS